MADGKPRKELTEEELIDQFRQMKVADLVLSTLFTLTQLGYGKLEPSARDLDQARLAIDSLGALLPVAKTAVPRRSRATSSRRSRTCGSRMRRRRRRARDAAAKTAPESAEASAEG
jgi:hypothetical protein